MSTYLEIRSQLETLSPQEQLLLLEDLAVLIRCGISQDKKSSLLELEGLGEEIWTQVDVEDYLNQERASWTG